jgi:hypothetical protein
LELPKDWVTAHLPHNIQIVKTGLFARTRVVVCSCGLSGVGRKVNMWAMHEAREMDMRAWLQSVQPKRPNNSFFR